MVNFGHSDIPVDLLNKLAQQEDRNMSDASANVILDDSINSHHNESDPTLDDHFSKRVSVVGLDLIGALILSICFCVFSLWRYGKQLEEEEGDMTDHRSSGEFGMYSDVVKQVEMRSGSIEKNVVDKWRNSITSRKSDFLLNLSPEKEQDNEPLFSPKLSNGLKSPQKVHFEEIPSSPEITSLISTPLLTVEDSKNYGSISDFKSETREDLDSYSTLPNSVSDKGIQCGSFQLPACIDTCECCSIITVPDAFKDSLITLESPKSIKKRRRVRNPQMILNKSASIANCLEKSIKIKVPKLVEVNKYQSFG